MRTKHGNFPHLCLKSSIGIEKELYSDVSELRASTQICPLAGEMSCARLIMREGLASGKGASVLLLESLRAIIVRFRDRLLGFWSCLCCSGALGRARESMPLKVSICYLILLNMLHVVKGLRLLDPEESSCHTSVPLSDITSRIADFCEYNFRKAYFHRTFKITC
jgi:hypothetical protein